MKRFLIPFFLLLALVPSWGQGAREKFDADPALARGIYRAEMSPVTAGTRPPTGYKPVYISHYGRHGARYMVSEKYYTNVLAPLEAAGDNLTPLGKRLLSSGRDFYDNVARGKAGDLTPVGWNQHRDIARQLVGAFPSLFRGNARVEASASTILRSVISMESFCVSLGQLRPSLQIYAGAGKSCLPWTLPENKEGASGSPKTPLPWTVTPKERLAGQIDASVVVSRLFGPGAVVEDPVAYCISLYDFLVSDQCTTGRVGISPLEVFTPDELYALWERDNLHIYERVAGNLPCYRSIIDDIIAREESDREEGISVRLRFGHDIGLYALAIMLGIDGAGRRPRTPDDVADIWQSWRTPMGSTLFLVKYASRRGEPLFKVILNGEEVAIDSLEPVSGPYYRWSDLCLLFGK